MIDLLFIILRIITEIVNEIVIEAWKGIGFSLSSSGSGEDVLGCAFVSASAEETSSKHGSSSTRRGSKGGVFSRMRSSRASPSSAVLYVNDPPANVSSIMADSLLSPNQKCCNSTWLGIDKSGLDLVKVVNLSQASPWDSFSSGRKLRIS